MQKHNNVSFYSLMMLLSFSTRFFLEHLKKGRNEESTLLFIRRILTRVVQFKDENSKKRQLNLTNQFLKNYEQILQNCENFQPDTSVLQSIANEE
jgi:hypothetical protein